MLKLKNLRITQGDFTLNANLNITKPRITAIVGPSGGGKSTLLSTIAGFIQPNSGQIILDGHDITKTPPGNRPITFLFQDHNLFAHLSVFQNIALGIRPNLRLSRQDRTSVHTALDRVNLQNQGDKKPGQLSGGQQQRVALARALLRDKPVLMLDEPFAALGPALKEEMLALVKQIADNSNMALLMVTHDPNDAKRIADETILLADGQAHPPVQTKTLFAHPPKSLSDYLGNPP